MGVRNRRRRKPKSTSVRVGRQGKRDAEQGQSQNNVPILRRSLIEHRVMLEPFCTTKSAFSGASGDGEV